MPLLRLKEERLNKSMMGQSNTKSIKDLIIRLIKEEGLEEGLQHARLYALWDELLGVTVAKNTRKKYMQGRTLFVYLNSSIVRNQLFMMRQDIIKQLNKKMGKEIIDALELH
jgi:predicted nucleic acid-binding Zn ribbon protein